MKIDLDKIEGQFMKHEHMVNGEMLYLVQPQHIGATWTRDNKIFRSSVWNALGELVSAGFPKFTNWGEAPEVFPVPTSLKGATVMEKLDGSLLIVSKYKGNYILRTRGTVDASKLDNGYELEIFKQTIMPLFGAWLNEESWKNSFLFEWVSPVNKIVLNYGEQPDWFLVGIVNHDYYSLWKQEDLDVFASNQGFKRPQTYTFSTVEDLIANVDKWEGKEGVCVYSNNDQTITKIKSAWYLVRHHMKSELSNMEKVMDFWFAAGKPDFLGLQEKIVAFDIELWAQPTIGFASKIAEGYKEVQLIIDHMKKFLLREVLTMPTRGLQAVVIKQAYGTTNRASFVFNLLDGKELDDKAIKKLMFQVLKK